MMTLSDLSTRELMNALVVARESRSRARSRWDYDEDEWDNPKVLVGKRYITGGVEIRVYATYDEIVAALRHREHVPNKIEAKRIRQLKAKRKQ